MIFPPFFTPKNAPFAHKIILQFSIISQICISYLNEVRKYWFICVMDLFVFVFLSQTQQLHCKDSFTSLHCLLSCDVDPDSCYLVQQYELLDNRLTRTDVSVTGQHWLIILSNNSQCCNIKFYNQIYNSILKYFFNVNPMF